MRGEDDGGDEAHCRRIVELAHVGVCTIDRDGRYTFVNPRLEELLTYPPGTMLGKHVFELLDEGAKEIGERYLERCRQGTPGGGDLRCTRLDGIAVWLSYELSAITEADGTYCGAVVIVTDVTERRDAQKSRDDLQGKMILADRIASVGTLAAGIGHEINNPLASIISNLEVIAAEVRDHANASPLMRWQELEEMIAETREGADRVRHIVRGLRTFSRSDEDRRMLLDVHPVLDAAIDLAFSEIKHRAQLVKAYAAVPLVEADEARLGQVFINLLVNAAHAIAEGSVDTNEIRVATTVDPSGRVIVEVRDTGRGIPRRYLARIFEPFFTTKPVGEGSGLGLSICHGIVTALGGEIEVESQVGKGSTFRIAIPPASADAKVAVERPKSMRLKTIRSGRVLVVDDDVSIGTALRRLLRDHEVTVTLNGKEALDVLRKDAAFDVILCDLMMPEMTGMALYMQLAVEMPAIIERMVFISGGAYTQATRAFLDDIPNERLEKPYEPQNLRVLVQRYVSATQHPR